MAETINRMELDTLSSMMSEFESEVSKFNGLIPKTTSDPSKQAFSSLTEADFNTGCFQKYDSSIDELSTELEKLVNAVKEHIESCNNTEKSIEESLPTKQPISDYSKSHNQFGAVDETSKSNMAAKELDTGSNKDGESGEFVDEFTGEQENLEDMKENETEQQESDDIDQKEKVILSDITPEQQEEVKNIENICASLDDVELKNMISSLYSAALANGISVEDLITNEAYETQLVDILKNCGIDENAINIINTTDSVIVRKSLYNMFFDESSSLGINSNNIELLKSHLYSTASENNVSLTELVDNKNNVNILRDSLAGFGDKVEQIDLTSGNSQNDLTSFIKTTKIISSLDDDMIGNIVDMIISN